MGPRPNPVARTVEGGPKTPGAMHWIAGIRRLSIPLSSISPNSRRRSSSPRSSSGTASGIFARSATRPSRCRTCTASRRSSDPNSRLRCFAPSPQRSRITATNRAPPLATCLPIEPGARSGRCSEGSRRRGGRAVGTTPHATSSCARSRKVSELDAGRAVVDLLKHGVSADSIWEGLFATAAEVVLRRPAVVPVHAQTSANAFHYVFRHARAETTQLLALLQSAAFMPAFRRGVRSSQPDLRVDELEPLAVSGDGAEALRDAFSDLPRDRTLRRPQGTALPATWRLRRCAHRQRTPAPGAQRPAGPRLQVHGGPFWRTTGR